MSSLSELTHSLMYLLCRITMRPFAGIPACCSSSRLRHHALAVRSVPVIRQWKSNSDQRPLLPLLGHSRKYRADRPGHAVALDYFGIQGRWRLCSKSLRLRVGQRRGPWLDLEPTEASAPAICSRWLNGYISQTLYLSLAKDMLKALRGQSNWSRWTPARQTLKRPF